MSLKAIVTSLVVVGCLFLWRRSRKTYSKRYLPPGPKPRPLVGNLFDLTLKELWLRVAEWAFKYGDVIYLRLFTQDMIFLNTVEKAFDLLEKRGAIYSDRRRTTMASELCGCDNVIAFAPYEYPSVRRQQRMLHTALAPAKLQTYHQLITNEVSTFLQRMLYSPADYVNNIKRYTGSQIMALVYGYKVSEDHDAYLKTAEDALFFMANHVLSPGSVWLVDFFPWLKRIPSWFPGGGFKSKAQRWRAEIERCADAPFDWVKDRMKRGIATPCYCTARLEEKEQEGHNADLSVDQQRESDIRWTADAFYIASIDTTLAMMLHFILAMMQYPDVARKAQETLDTVTGSTRLPTFEDRPALPYIDAVLSECMRWTAPVPFGLPHRLMEDDIYEGMAIPKGTLVFANVCVCWTMNAPLAGRSMSRDPVLFPDPEAFIPERYLEQTDDATARKREPRNFIFGFGRRKCPGAHLAETYIWLAIARLLATFDFAKATDAEGRTVEPRPEYHDASFSKRRDHWTGLEHACNTLAMILKPAQSSHLLCDLLTTRALESNDTSRRPVQFFGGA
ncbi:cytochrome P450 [Lenzites betulinus]|nr:cytochrome P450 [Lenzites betulinus]